MRASASQLRAGRGWGLARQLPSRSSNGRQAARVSRLRRRAKSEEETKEVFDENINPYCSLDESGAPMKKKRTLGEMEQDYLDALRQFYESGSPSMSDEEFDILKDELTWGGSSVVLMSKEEQLFLEATKAYAMGKPIMDDDKFNDLKIKLKEQGSTISVGGPRCSIRSKRVFTDLEVDYLRLTLLNAPAAVIALGITFLLDKLSGFYITEFLELPEPLGFVAVWFITLPILYVLADSITKLVVKEALILKGQCTNCGAPQVMFFGQILGSEGNDEITDIKCESCKTVMSANKRTRELSQVTK